MPLSTGMRVWNAFLAAIVYKDGGGSRDMETAAKSTRCIPETTEGVGSQRNRQKKHVTPF